MEPEGAAIREQDKFLPIANISRIMKEALPQNAKISKDAKELVQQCVSDFIIYITSEASGKCQREKRKTVNGDDLLWAMRSLGFEDAGVALSIYLAKIREAEGAEKKGGSHEAASALQAKAAEQAGTFAQPMQGMAPGYAMAAYAPVQVPGLAEGPSGHTPAQQMQPGSVHQFQASGMQRAQGGDGQQPSGGQPGQPQMHHSGAVAQHQQQQQVQHQQQQRQQQMLMFMPVQGGSQQGGGMSPMHFMQLSPDPGARDQLPRGQPGSMPGGQSNPGQP